jgi:hypothetical protein
MRALVVHESMFGNTEVVAEAIGAGLAAEGIEVDVVPVRDAPVGLEDIDLLVVGGPTHAFSMSRPATRADAEAKGADHDAAEGVGLREWIDRIQPVPRVAVAVFDTKVRHPHLPGSAARAARKHLRSHGFKAVDPPTTFWVDGMAGPLLDGEEERARAWAADLGAAVVAHSVRPS